jgi:hypothetical protein
MKGIPQSRALLRKSLYKDPTKLYPIRPKKGPQYFNFDKLDYKERHTIYRLYREKKSANSIARLMGYQETAFCQQWIENLRKLIGEFEAPLTEDAVPGYGKSKVEFNMRELQLIKMAVIAGRTHAEIASLLGVKSDTLTQYRKLNPKIDDYMRQGYEEELLRVEMAIHRRAIGMTTKDTKFASYMGRFTDQREIKLQHLPDPRSAELVMVNKRGWRSGNVGNPAQSSDKGKILKLIEELTANEQSPKQEEDTDR